MKQAIELIKKWEGFRSAPYQDIAGVWTIGYGTTNGITKDTKPIDEAEADQLLRMHLAATQRYLDSNITAPLSENMNSALLSLIYNIGTGNFANSTLRKVLNRGQYMQAAAEFGRWIYAGGNPLKGLQQRRYDEATLFCTPVTKGD